MELERRYVVFKIKDLVGTSIEKNVLELSYFYDKTIRNGKSSLKGIFIEHDWPEYPIALKLLSDRVDRDANLVPLPPRKPHSHYFKDVSGLTEIDVYKVCQLFEVNDPSGATHHAIKKLLLPGKRGAGKDRVKDIREARDSLNRLLEILDESETTHE